MGKVFLVQFMKSTLYLHSRIHLRVTSLIGENLKNLKKGMEVRCRGGFSEKGGRGWHFSYLIFWRFIIFTFRNYLLQNFVMHFKHYLHCKMTTSQKVLSEAQIKNFFILKKNYVSFSRYSSFCIFNHLMIYQICDVTVSISTWDNLHFWIYFLNHNSWSHQTRSVDRYK